jgi:hypothetical protein
MSDERPTIRPTRKEIALLLLRTIGPNPAEFMALGADAFRDLASKIDALYRPEGSGRTGGRLRAVLRENKILKRRNAELEKQIAGSVEIFQRLRWEPESILDEGD